MKKLLKSHWNGSYAVSYFENPHNYVLDIELEFLPFNHRKQGLLHDFNSQDFDSYFLEIMIISIPFNPFVSTPL